MQRDLIGMAAAVALRERLTDRAALGLFLLTASPLVAEVCSTLPLDWLVLDMEAAPVDRRDALAFLQAVRPGAHGAPVPFVRTACREHTHVEQLLDLGFLGLIIPKVHDRAAALASVAAARYPPLGSRGINPVRASGYFSDVPRYLHEANQGVSLFVQIESREAVANCSDIASVEGIDGLFVGMGDLAMSLGQPGDVTGPAMEDALTCVLEACRRHRKIPGVFAYNPQLGRQYVAAGFRFVAVGNDVGALRQGVSEIVRAVTRP